MSTLPCSLLYAETLATSARSFDIRIIKHKLCRQFRLYKVHLGAQQRHLCLLVYDYSHAILHNFLVHLLFGRCIVECVAETIAASLFYANFQSNLEQKKSSRTSEYQSQSTLENFSSTHKVTFSLKQLLDSVHRRWCLKFNNNNVIIAIFLRNHENQQKSSHQLDGSSRWNQLSFHSTHRRRCNCFCCHFVSVKCR